MPSMWLLSDEKTGVRRDVLALYNWDSTDKAIGCDAAKAGLKSGVAYHAFDFWANAPAPEFTDRFSFDVPKESCRILAVRAAEDHPVLVSTSRHVTQGVVDVANERWRDGIHGPTHTLSATTKVVGGDPYELRIAGVKEGWKLAAVRVSAEDQAAGVTIAPVKSEDGWLRVVIRSKDGREVKWSVEFAK
jgi:hypothetical protein